MSAQGRHAQAEHGGARVVFVTGTGTEVGKTVTTAAIAALALASRQRVAVLKPCQTGLSAGSPGDVDEVARLAGALTTRELARYPDPLAPETASRRCGLPPVRPEHVGQAVAELSREHDLVLVEGAGGLLVRYDDQGHALADMARAVTDTGLRPEVLVVAAAGLGTLNTTALTLEALRSRDLPPLGVVVGSWPREPDLADRCNLVDLPKIAATPLLGALSERIAASRGRDSFRRFAQAGLAPALGGRWDAAAFTESQQDAFPS
ncbi:dethiobiotin synthase [Streptomyces sp. NBC_00063]|uniref:dethiobiotin synthase n=1 Tax=Streptomyces sp. NBC_00063 TaxID=2975638 RepID=UPI0022572262|nr:dethiobiotin synthase [Streptomyces sp. NBC_00063]MCX5435766.1 dethiobiotin synthase [Streptomyces sp. NBC_00063]